MNKIVAVVVFPLFQVVVLLDLIFSRFITGVQPTITGSIKNAWSIWVSCFWNGDF